MQKHCKNCGDVFSAVQDWKTYCIPCFIKIKKSQENQSNPIVIRSKYILDEEMLNRVIRLCHPDKHNNSKAATEITQLLLEMKGE